MNKKGLANGLLAMMLVLFTFAVVSLIAFVAWNEFDTSIQGLDNATASQETKDAVSGLGEYILWGDKLFVWLFVALLVGFLISSVTIPVDEQVYLVVYFVILVLFTILAMILSNSWTHILNMPVFSLYASDMSFTNNFMQMFPIYMFITGLIGGILFYLRKKSDIQSFNTGGTGFD